MTADDKRIEVLKEVAQKVESSLLGSINGHKNSSEFSSNQGLDYLDSKNCILLSYLIELTHWLRYQLADEPVPETCLHRLLEMRTILDKVRVLDKKLRYQIDKLLTYQTANLATAGDDPLLYRPRAGDDSDDSSASEDDEEKVDQEEKDDGSDESVHGLDDDLATARLTLAMAREKKQQTESGTDTNNDGLYHAPRHAAVPYMLETNKEEHRAKRRLQQLRASEVADTIRHQYSEAPELEDSHGATSIGKQRASSRRMAERQEERTAFEEDNMIRLTVTRQEKKDNKKMIRQEHSNLHAISDLGNLVNESTLKKGKKKGRGRVNLSEEPRKKTRTSGPKNGLQAALQGQEKRKKKR